MRHPEMSSRLHGEKIESTMRNFFNTILNAITLSFFEGTSVAYPVVNDHATINSILESIQ